MGDSDKAEVGEWVVAIGNPFGLEKTVTAGIISAKGRSNLNIAQYEDWIQTDAAINPGNSGGPLVNLDGQVIGINSAIFTRTGVNGGVGFAVPSNMAKNIMDQIIKHGKVTRSYMGVWIQPINKDLAEQFDYEDTHGALVADVIADSPAEKAGLKTGDIVRRYDGKRVKNDRHLSLLVASTPVGEEVKLEILRDGKPMTLTVKPAERKDETVASAKPGEEVPERSLGLTVQNLTPEIADQLGYKADAGVVVTEVDPDSPAAQAGLQPGDMILEINRQKIDDTDDFHKKIRGLKENKKALLLVRNDRGTRFTVLSAR
jgi:serine protease Do